MEDTHMVDADKIEKLLFILAIAFCWAYRTGDIKEIEESVEIKTHGRRAKSIFRKGLDLILRVVFGGAKRKEWGWVFECFRFLKTVGCAQ